MESALAKYGSTVEGKIDWSTIRIDKLGQTLREATDKALRQIDEGFSRRPDDLGTTIESMVAEASEMTSTTHNK